MATTPVVPVSSVGGIEALITFGLNVFLQVFQAFRHPTAPVPVSAAPQIVQTLQSTPGISEDHKTVINNAVSAAAAAHSATA